MTSAVVDIVVDGRSGSVAYREGEHVHRFDWEFGGHDVLMIIYVPPPADWDAKVPWAAGRRGEVLETLAAEVRRQKWGSGCRIEMFERWIHLCEAPPWPKRLARALRKLLG